jgi:acylphosphatase
MGDAVTIRFVGRFQTASFLEFARHRAARLALHAAVRAATSNHIELVVAGEEDLVDAFEIACSLGPIDCLVFDYRRVSPGEGCGELLAEMGRQ